MPSKSHKELFSTHAEYNKLLNEKLCLLYQGGFAIQQKASLFLEKLDGLENNQAYQRRLKSVSYIPYLSEFITQFGASLFSEELEIKQPVDAEDASTLGGAASDEFYKDFIQSCDLLGRPAHQFFHDIFEMGMHQLKVYVGIDFPKNNSGLMPINRLMEKQMGLSNAYFYTIPYDTVIDWKKDEQNQKFIWLKTFEECFPDDDPLVEAKHYYRFKIWTVKEGKGHWQIWESERMPLTKSFTINTKYNKTDEGDTSFPEIPIQEFCIPSGYHVGQQIGSICQEHYQRRSFMVSNANKTCVSLGVVTLGPEVSSPGDSLPPDIEPYDTPSSLRSRLESDGWVVLRQTDKWADKVDIVEAKGESHKFIAEELKHLVEAMMQTLRQMNMTATANLKAQGRSAASKAIDQHGTSMLLSIYREVITEFARRLMMLLTVGRNNGEKIAWVVAGLSTAEPVAERKDVIEEVTKMGVSIHQLPEMVQSRYLFKVANELLDNNLSDKEKLEVQEKIEEMVASGVMHPEEPNGSAASNPTNKSSNSDNAEDAEEQMALGPSGQPLMPEGAHLQTGEHVDSQVVFEQLAEDYKEKDIQFVLHIPWVGPVEVPLSSIDFSNKDNWQAASPEDQEHVDMFAKKMAEENYSKPIILVNNPSNDNKMMVVDGHHRAMAALKNNQPVNAYVGTIGSNRGPWDKLHSKQVGSKQESLQKEASNQVNKSEDGNSK